VTLDEVEGLSVCHPSRVTDPGELDSCLQRADDPRPKDFPDEWTEIGPGGASGFAQINELVPLESSYNPQA